MIPNKPALPKPADPSPKVFLKVLSSISHDLTLIRLALERLAPAPAAQQGPEPPAQLLLQTDEDFALMEELERQSGRGEEDRQIGFGAELVDAYMKTKEDGN